MSIFPSTPEVNDTFTSNGTTWKWDGSSWNFFSSPAFIGVGGDATVAFQIDQPDVSELEAGALWIDSDEDISNGLLVATFTRWVSLLSSSALVLEGLDDNDLALLYTPGFEKVYVNGILLVRGEDYTAEDGTTIQLTVAAEEGDVVEIDVFESFAIADTYTKAQSDAKFFAVNSSRVDRWTKTYSASATVITGSDDNAFALDYLVGLESVFVNGVLLAPEEYTRTSASVITLDEAVLAGDVVDIISPKAFEVANTYTIEQIDSRYNNYSRWTKTFSASATVLTGLDDSSNTLSYRAGYEKIYLNGILLIKDIDYTTTDENTITLNEAVVINDTINIISFEPFNIADTYTQEESDNKFLTQNSASSTYLEKSVVEGAWTTYTPTWTNLTVGNATQTAKYRQIGKILFFEARIIFGTTTSITGRVSLDWPIAPVNQESANMASVNLAFDDVTDGPFPGLKFNQSATTTKFELLAINAAGTYAKYNVLSSTVPFTWTTSDQINLSGFYEVA